MMTTRDQATHDHALHKEQAARERTEKDDHGETEQGIVKDERGQDQPSDKKRATQNRRCVGFQVGAQATQCVEQKRSAARS